MTNNGGIYSKTFKSFAVFVDKSRSNFKRGVREIIFL